MSGLTAEDFSEFYMAVNRGRTPFPWQSDLVEQILATGKWPSAIDVPTGLGKTSVIDIAVFVAAATVDLPPSARPGRRRVFFVVDRRLVVDEAFAHAAGLGRTLDGAVDDVSALGEVARRLQRYAPHADERVDIAEGSGAGGSVRPVLPVTRMRGGVSWDRDWLSRPDLPGVVIGTVDQVGSRLLFRGYGLSDYRLPIDAALVGTDSLVLVDEAHLATAMTSTLRAARQRDCSVLPLAGSTMVLLSATQVAQADREAGNADVDSPYRLNPDQHRDDAVAWKRLTAAKSLRLRLVDEKKAVATLKAEVVALEEGQHRTILAVCNTVDRARQVHGELVKHYAKRGALEEVTVDLLIGRSRSADREALVAEVLDRFGIDRDRQRVGVSILVATQTVEVGVNLDAEAIVTESAPWDSLVQRLGRLNRLGEQDGVPALAVVVHDGVDDGPVYGEARDRCWSHLHELVSASTGGMIDVSPLRCRELAASFAEKGGIARSPAAPMVSAAVLDRWAATSPRPHNDIEVAPYLHGLGRTSPSVQVAWREGTLNPAADFGIARLTEAELTLSLREFPVLSAEQVELPLHTVRRWMQGEAVGPVSDLDSDTDPSPKVKQAREAFEVLVWRADVARKGERGGRWVWSSAAGIRPGDQIVVPAEEGGLDRYGWAPTSRTRVVDVSEAVRFGAVQSERTTQLAPRRVLRLDAGLGRRLGLDEDAAASLWTEVSSSLRTEDPAVGAQIVARLRKWANGLLSAHGHDGDSARVGSSAWTASQLRGLSAWLGDHPVVQVIGERDAIDESEVYFEGAEPIALLADSGDLAENLVRDDVTVEGSSAGGVAVGLAQHHRNVGDRAAGIATSLGLDERIVRSVELAARLHDHGKQEERFQAMLSGGDAYAALLLPEPLAKSGMDPRDRRGFWMARRRSRLPSGARHEAWSAAIAAKLLAVEDHDVDRDLVVHLVLSHHGRGRRSLMPVIDDAPTEIVVKDGDTQVEVTSAVAFDYEQAERFAELSAYYGRWGLALLESAVRCSDMTVSGEGS